MYTVLYTSKRPLEEEAEESRAFKLIEATHTSLRDFLHLEVSAAADCPYNNYTTIGRKHSLIAASKQPPPPTLRRNRY